MYYIYLVADLESNLFDKVDRLNLKKKQKQNERMNE